MVQVKEMPLRDGSDVTAGPSGALLASLHHGLDGVPVISPPDLTDVHTVDTRRLRRVSLSIARNSAPLNGPLRSQRSLSDDATVKYPDMPGRLRRCGKYPDPKLTVSRVS